MFVGNFLIGSLKPAQQLELIQAKNLKKLQIFCRKERLDKSAEAYLIEHSECLESVLEYSLKNYGAFQNENNDLFFKCHRANKELLLLFLKVAPLNFDYMTEMLCMVDAFPQVGELFKQSFQKLSDEDKATFINQLKQDEKLFCVFWQIVPLKITEVSLFEAFLVYYQNQPDVLNNYVSMYSLPEEFLKVLQKKHLWSLMKVYADVVKENMRLIFKLKDVSFEIETLLFDDENEHTLLEYVSQRRFQHHDNEMRFLLLGRKYPSEVEQYLAKYGKNISFTDEELLKFLQNQKNGIEHIRVKSLAMYRDYILPEKRKKLIPFSEEDLPMLIRLSYDNPLLLEQFITEHGKVSPQYEAELFFRADEKCREKYIELYDINLQNLVQNAPQYGVTKTEQQLLNVIDWQKLSALTLLNDWNIFGLSILQGIARRNYLRG